MEKTDQKLALKGGEPFRTKPFPAWPQFNKRDIEQVVETLRSGIWSRAKNTNHLKFAYETNSKAGKFEQLFKRMVGTENGILVNSGTSALHLIFQALHLEPGSEVITTPYTFFSTIAPLLKFGLKPVFVDIREDGNINPDLVAKTVTEQTKAVLIMHCGGQPCEMTRLRKLCDQYGLLLIQDNAHALTSTYEGKHVAAYGDVSMFSFEASKSLNCGEGGFVTTDSSELFERMFSIHSCGRPFGGDWRSHIEMSENYRPSELQASLAITQLEKVHIQQETKKKNRKLLDKLLENHPLVEPINLDERMANHGNYSYLLKIRSNCCSKLSGKRLAIYLETEGIPCNSGYTKLVFDIDYCHNFIQKKERDLFLDQCPTAKDFLQRTVWLPQTILLGSSEDIRDVVGALDKISACLLSSQRGNTNDW